MEHTELNPILSAAMSAAKASAVRTEISAKKQEQITEEALTTAGILQTAIQDKAKARGTINITAGLAELGAQNARIETFDAAGGIEFQKELMSAYAVAGKELLTANKKLASAQDREVTGPIDYFKKINEVNKAFWKAEGIEDKRDDIGETIQGITSQQESITRALNTTKKILNTAVINAGQTAIAEQANIEAAKADLASKRDNAVALRASMDADARQVASKIEIVRLHGTAEALKHQKIKYAASVEVHKEKMKIYREAAKARKVDLVLKEEQLEEVLSPQRRALVSAQRDRLLKTIESDIITEALYTSNVQIGQTVTGVAVEEVSTIIKQGMEAKTFKERLRYEKLRQIGLREEQAFGLSPADALETISITGADPRLPPVKLLVMLNQDYQKAKAAKKEELPKDQETYNSEFDTHTKPIIAGWRAEIKEGDESNPFQAPPMAVLLEYKSVQDSKFFKTILDPMAMKEFNAKRIYEAAVTGIAANTITAEEAAMGIETLFNAAISHNNETKMFARAGIVAQDSYISEIVPPPFFSEKVIGATTGAAAGVAAVVGAGLLATPPGVLAAALAVGGATLLGGEVTGFGAGRFPLTDSTNRTQIMQAIVKLMANKEGILGGLF